MLLTRFYFKTSYSISLFESVRFNVVLLIQFKHMLWERICGHERVCRAVARTSPTASDASVSEPTQSSNRCVKKTYLTVMMQRKKSFQTNECRVAKKKTR